MDVLLNEYTDANGRAIIDFSLTPTEAGGVLPVRNGVWYTAEMSDPARFVSAVNGTLTVVDPIGVVAARTLFLTTDISGVGMEVQTVYGDAEIKQRAVVACMLQKGTVPSMPLTGNLTAELLTESVAPSVYNATLQTNIQELAQTLSYRPLYKYEHEALVVEVTEV